MRGHINTVKRVKNDHDNPNLGPLDGKIFPGHRVLEELSKMDTNVCRCVKMRAEGYNRVYDDGECEKQVKKRCEQS